MANSAGKSITVGITGASGAIYAQTLLRMLDADARVERSVSGGERNRHAADRDRTGRGAKRAEKAGRDADRHGGGQDRMSAE